MKTSNPALRSNVFIVDSHELTQSMTMQGTAIKTFFLLALATLSAGWLWHKFADISIITNFQSITTYAIGGSIAGFILALCTIFKPSWSPITAPIYALFEGLALGSISLVLERQYPGIVLQALPLTFGTLAMMLIIYTLGIIKVTHRFRMMIFSATAAIGFVYLLSSILRFFGVMMPYIHDSGTIGIAFSLFVVGVASFNLLLDLDFIHKGEEHHAPKYMEWYGAFSLMVSLVWLYIEILNLLVKLRERKRR